MQHLLLLFLSPLFCDSFASGAGALLIVGVLKASPLTSVYTSPSDLGQGKGHVSGSGGPDRGKEAEAEATAGGGHGADCRDAGHGARSLCLGPGAKPLESGWQPGPHMGGQKHCPGVGLGARVHN